MFQWTLSRGPNHTDNQFISIFRPCCENFLRCYPEAFLTSAQEKKKLQFPIRSGKVGGGLLAAIGNYSRSGRTSGYSLIGKIVCRNLQFVD